MQSNQDAKREQKVFFKLVCIPDAASDRACLYRKNELISRNFTTGQADNRSRDIDIQAPPEFSRGAYISDFRRESRTAQDPDVKKYGNGTERPIPRIIHIGCAGWNIARQSIAHFEREGTHLERYSRTFNCCEINSSFYRPHKYSTWERWSASVPEEFRFSVKLPRTITHDAELKCGPGDLAAFFKQVTFLGEKLGPVLIQLPPRCAFDHATAKDFFIRVREQHGGDVVLEARHPTWFTPRADDLLKEFSITGVAADPACVPAAGHPTGFRQLVYFRLHGAPRRYYSAYSDEFLEGLSRRIVDLAEEARVWCIFDNTAGGLATPNALQLNQKTTEAKTFQAGL